MIAIVAAVLLGQSPIGDRKLVFEQDFAHMSDISESDWDWYTGPNYNMELEKRTPKSGHNAFLENGELILEARKENGIVTSAMIQSKKFWTHPFVEVVASVPVNGKGNWPAIWMLNQKLREPNNKVGWPKCGEIDIMENVSYDPKNFHFSLHCENYNWQKPQQRTKAVAVDNPGGFHKFGMAIDPGVLTFYLDDKPAYVVKETGTSYDDWPFDDGFYLILNLAIGGTWGGSQGVDESIYPSRFRVKSVKVYQ
jgi:beta-glucanase (GH16 family)